MEECPVCYDTKPLCSFWGCGHGICDGCAYAMHEDRANVKCPLCRAEPTEPLTLFLTDADKYAWINNRGTGLVGYRATKTAAVIDTAATRTGWLMDTYRGAALLMRHDDEGVWAYGAITAVSPAVCELFCRCPREEITPRASRAWIRSLQREIDGAELEGGARAFLRGGFTLNLWE